MCKVMNISSSGYYNWLQGLISPRAHRTAAIKADVRHVYAANHGIYGSYKIAEVMRNNETMQTACRNTIARAMREMGLKSCVSRRFRPATTVVDPSQRPASNILDQQFKATTPNQKWVTDITYLPTLAGWVYLAVVIDLFSRKVVGWSMSDRLTTPLVSAAMRQAIEQRRPRCEQLLHHSDRGCQYTSESYQQMLSSLGITCSMSRTGCCYDNAVAERFFWSLKHEWTNSKSFRDLESARWSIFKYIETFYNSTRIHQTLGYQTPNQFEKNHAATTAA